MYKAKRSDHTSAATDQKTLQGTNSKEDAAEEQTLGRFQMKQGANLSCNVADPEVRKLTFSFNNPFSGKGKENEESKEGTLTFKPITSLDQEKKFVVNKDLFTNPFVRNPFKTSEKD